MPSMAISFARRGAALASALALVLSASAQARPVVSGEAAAYAQPPASDAERVLAIHNSERARLGLPPLRWNPVLARDAGQWARELAVRGVAQHSAAASRSGHGENLWMGTAGTWNTQDMLEMFLDERRYFRAAAFPYVSLTGDWTDVGHYSQIVWRDTREIGCAVDTGKGMDVLVCRYFPAGNVMGQSPF